MPKRLFGFADSEESKAATKDALDRRGLAEERRIGRSRDKETLGKRVLEGVSPNQSWLRRSGSHSGGRHTRRPRLRLGAPCCARTSLATNRQRRRWPNRALGGSRRRGRLAAAPLDFSSPSTPRRFTRTHQGLKDPAPPISLCCCTTRARVDGQNAQKAKIARYAGCEHNRDAVRADP